MRNRAKCKLCNSVIESFHSEDYVFCKCDEIGVSNGAAMNCHAKNWNNFVRVDDEGNEVVTVVKNAEDELVKPALHGENPSRQELLTMLYDLIKSIENLPTPAMTAPVTHYDLSAALSLILAIFRS